MARSVPQNWYENLKASVCLSRLEGKSVAEVARNHGVTRDFVRYHERKLVDPDFHPGTQGGARHVSFASATQLQLECLLWNLVKADPLLLPGQYAEEMRQIGFDIDRR
jgi:hypothetical protein